MSSPCRLCLGDQPDMVHLARDDMMVCAEHHKEKMGEARSMNTILMVELAVYKEAAEASAALAAAIKKNDPYYINIAERYTLAWEKVQEIEKRQ